MFVQKYNFVICLYFSTQITAFFAGKDRLGQRLTAPEYFLCGMFTGSVAALVEGPIDLVRTIGTDAAFRLNLMVQAQGAHTSRVSVCVGILQGSHYGELISGNVYVEAQNKHKPISVVLKKPNLSDLEGSVLTFTTGYKKSTVDRNV